MRTVPCRFTYLNIVVQVGCAVWKAKETLEGEALLEEKHCLEQALGVPSAVSCGRC